MRSFVAFGILAFIAHAKVQEKEADPLVAHLMNMTDSESQEFAGKFVDKLVNKLYDGMHQLAVSDSNSDGTYNFDDKLINEVFNGQLGAANSQGLQIPTWDDRYPNSYVLGVDDAENYAYDRFNSDIDPNLESAAKMAVAMMKQRHENQAAPGLEIPTRDGRFPNSYTLGDQDAANYAYERYNSDIDPKMASEAEAAVSKMRQVHALNAPEEQELAESSTDTMSMAAMALMVFFVSGLLTFAMRRFRSNLSTGNKEALMAGYSQINA